MSQSRLRQMYQQFQANNKEEVLQSGGRRPCQLKAGLLPPFKTIDDIPIINPSVIPLA